ncbi:MAG: hypothetical protein EOO01_19175 [Chitinophagaceae bacterium]|nr:MAG: hypothetical protein EOO01_19175 [Chitinophagaceae bacterium]
MKKGIPFLRVLLLMWFCNTAIAHSPDPFFLQHYDNRNGLSNSSINHIYKDAGNLLWVATWDGLNMYDGSIFHVFNYSRENDSKSIGSNVIQQVTEEAVLNLAREAKRLTGSDNLCMAGGVSLNCVANGKLDEAKIFKNIFITPAAGDAGGALGAALAAYHIYYEQPRKELNGKLDNLSGSYLGPEYSSLEVETLMRKYNAEADEYKDESSLAEQVAQLIAEGAVIGWHQGRMEFGPRALGARSIIADARNSTMQKKLNLKIKYREGFRPFAPIVLAEDVSEYFNHDEPSPYMLIVKPVKNARQIPYPTDYKENGLLDKLYFLRSDIPAVTHIDYSARLQTVHKETNGRLWNLLNTFKKLTGYSVLVNTSFNVRGEPIVNTPEDAYRCFMRTDMDYLVVGNFIFDKKKQPKWEETQDWRSEFVLD